MCFSEYSKKVMLFHLQINHDDGPGGVYEGYAASEGVLPAISSFLARMESTHGVGFSSTKAPVSILNNFEYPVLRMEVHRVRARQAGTFHDLLISELDCC